MDDTTVSTEVTSAPEGKDNIGRATTAATSSPATHFVPKAGITTTQFWLLAGVLALTAWMVFAGKLDATWFELLAPLAALIYAAVREGIYREAVSHPNDPLDRMLRAVLDRMPEPTGEDVARIVAALGSATTPVRPALKSPTDQSPSSARRADAAPPADATPTQPTN